MSDYASDIPRPSPNHVLGFSIVAITLFIIGSTVSLFINHFRNVNRSLSLRRGAQRRRFIVLFLVLASICFFVVTTLKYADAGARAEMWNTLDGKLAVINEKIRTFKQARHDELAAAGTLDDLDVAQVEVPDSLPGQRYMVVKQLPWLRWFTDPLRGITEYLLKHGHNFGYLLAGNLASIGKPGIYWWATEYWFGTVCWVFFLGYQTRLRALPWSTPILLSLLAIQFSLSGSQSLLFALMLMSPIRDTTLERWTPNRALVLIPFWLHVASYAYIPVSIPRDLNQESLENGFDWELLSVGVFFTELAVCATVVAVAWIHPRRLGRYHTTALDARSHRATTFALVALPTVLLRVHAASRAFRQAGNELDTTIWWYAKHKLPREATGEAYVEMMNASYSTLGVLGSTGRFNTMAWDVVLSAFMLGLWTALAESDPRILFRCTLLPWLKDEEEVLIEQQVRAREETRSSWLDAVKQLASAKTLTRFSRNDQDEGPTTGTAEAYVRKRGRPPKHRKSASGNESGYAIVRSKSKSKSPGRPRKSVSPYKRPASRARSQSRARSHVRQHVRSDIANGTLGITVAGWEAAGVTWCLAALGGLGVATIAVFGAEAADFM